MVVKQNRGRKRYILFSHDSNVSRNQIDRFLRNHFKELKGKIRSKLMKYNSSNGVLRVDHKLTQQAREIMNDKGREMGIETIRTSGTLKGLE